MKQSCPCCKRNHTVHTFFSKFSHNSIIFLLQSTSTSRQFNLSFDLLYCLTFFTISPHPFRILFVLLPCTLLKCLSTSHFSHYESLTVKLEQSAHFAVSGFYNRLLVYVTPSRLYKWIQYKQKKKEKKKVSNRSSQFLWTSQKYDVIVELLCIPANKDFFVEPWNWELSTSCTISQLLSTSCNFCIVYQHRAMFQLHSQKGRRFSPLFWSLSFSTERLPNK